MSASLDEWSLPPIPTEIKHLIPYFQRAQELRTRDPAMAYWCAFYGLQAAISVKLPTVNRFIGNVLPVLEQIKVTHADDETIMNDAAASAYVENFAMRVFTMADNEDRKGLATRATAKKFLASANFLEVVQIFRILSETDAEKIRYAKWKAADIAKAFREGRKPIPGDAQSLPGPFGPSPPLPPPSLESQSTFVATTNSSPSPLHAANVPLPPSDVDTHSPRLHSASPPSLHPVDSAITHSSQGASAIISAPPPRTPSPQEHLSGVQVTSSMWSTTATPGVEGILADNRDVPYSPTYNIAAARKDEKSLDTEGCDAHDDGWSTVANDSVSRQNSWTAPDTNGSVEIPPLPPSPMRNGLDLYNPVEITPAGRPAATAVKRVHFSPSVIGGLSSASNSVVCSSPPPSPQEYVPSLPTVDETPYASEPVHPHMYMLPESETSTSDTPGSPEFIPPPIVHRVPISQISSSSISSAREISLPSPNSSTRLPHPQAYPPVLHPTPRSLPAHSNQGSSFELPPSLTLAQMGQAQKHCRFAISALDFEDTETARMELRKALAMLGD